MLQNEIRQNMVGICNWDKPEFTMEMCEELFANMKLARISAEYYFLFSAKAFAPGCGGDGGGGQTVFAG